MPTRTPAKAEAEASNMLTYVVVADAVTVSSGKRAPSGRMTTVRLVRGERLQAAADHPSVVELLAMHSIVEEGSLKETMLAYSKKGNAKRQHAQGKDERGNYRITASGVASALSNADDPALEPLDGILPVDAGLLDTTPTVVES